MRMIYAVLYREYKIRTTSMTWLFYDLFMPLTYLLLFGVGLDRAFHGGIEAGGMKVGYNAFFLAGVLAMASFGIAINTSYGFFVDRDNGIFFEFLTHPMTRGEFLIGKILFNCLLALLQSTITVVIGVIVLDIPFLWERSIFLFAGIITGTAGWFFFLTTFALRIRRNDIFNTLINVIYFILMFASTLFYPVDGMPVWLRWLSLANPLTWHADVLRFLTIGVGSPGTVAIEALLFVTFLALAFWQSVRTLSRDILN